jgi:dephospho-CoA kinase
MPADPFQSADPSQRRIPVIGVVGGIGSGKSAVTRWVAERCNVLVVDADQLGHQALRFDDVKSALRQRFGDGIFDESGEVRRGALARCVFGDSDQQRAARHDLERIVHPVIERQAVELIDQAAREGREAVLLDAAVLFEAGWQNRCDAVVFVEAPDDVRQRRVAARNGWSPAELRRRESSQLGLKEKRERSDRIISNATDDSLGGQELLDFLCRDRGVCCKPLSNSSQQS